MDEIVVDNEADETEEEQIVSELEMPMWSVIGFESVIKSGLTYIEAQEVIASKQKESVRGLCIVTDEAAERFDE